MLVSANHLLAPGTFTTKYAQVQGRPLCPAVPVIQREVCQTSALENARSGSKDANSQCAQRNSESQILGSKAEKARDRQI